jgi:hypothetical protein
MASNPLGQPGDHQQLQDIMKAPGDPDQVNIKTISLQLAP